MSPDQVVSELVLTFGGTIGRTAQPGSQAWEACRGLDFVLCPHSVAVGPGRDYIARGPNGGIWYIGINRAPGVNYGVISCGQKGFHFLNGTEPCI